jgi:DNA-binding NtrC family response regulator
MINVLIDVADAAARATLKAMLEADGFGVTAMSPDAVITDESGKAVSYARSAPTLMLAEANAVPQAVAAMRRGVYGYIFMPFQPGEASMMVNRAIAGTGGAPAAQSKTISLAQEETRLIREAMRACKNNKTEAARLLGIGRNTLWRKLKKHRESDSS